MNEKQNGANEAPSVSEKSLDAIKDDDLVEFEDIIEDLGSFGHWQRVIFFLISAADVFGAFAMLVPVFIGSTPGWYCTSFSDPAPAGGAGGGGGGAEVSTAAPLGLSNLTKMTCDRNGSKCASFVFTGEFTSIVSEWDLVCDRKYLSDLITSVQMAGLVLGAALFGQLSDSLGRKKSYFTAFLIMIIPGFVSGFSPVVELYAACRFFVGMGFGAQMVVNCVYPLEFVGQRWRTLCGTIGFWAIGGMLLALFGFLLPHWRHLVILTTASGIFFLISWPFIPESPRWLIQKGRLQEAHTILAKIAAKNNKPEPEMHVLERYMMQDRAQESWLKAYTYLHLFRTWRYCRRALIVAVIWFTTFIMYYELTFNLRNLSGNRYLNMFYGGFVDFAAMLSVIFLNNALGRKFTQLTFLLISVAANLVIIFVTVAGEKEPLSDLILAAALIGKATALGGTYVAQIFTAELFPTVIRNQGVGIGSVAGRVGGIVSPQIVFLAYYYELTPHIVTTVLCVICLPLLFLLPETNGTPLEDSFNPIEKKSRQKPKSPDGQVDHTRL